MMVSSELVPPLTVASPAVHPLRSKTLLNVASPEDCPVSDTSSPPIVVRPLTGERKLTVPASTPPTVSVTLLLVRAIVLMSASEALTFTFSRSVLPCPASMTSASSPANDR